MKNITASIVGATLAVALWTTSIVGATLAVALWTSTVGGSLKWNM
jgi:hypothetical protein